MNVLSLFDGISCGQLALCKAGIPYEKYYSSEIDKHAITVTQTNFPNTIQLGDINNFKTWRFKPESIDLILCGFPCQSWSVGGNQLGDKDPRGQLFWTMLKIIKFVKKRNPNVLFLMENVKMKSEFEKYITFHIEDALGTVEKHLIDSALVSAQRRKRYYWTNIKGITQPRDRGILLNTILEDKWVTDRKKSHCIDANYHKGGNVKTYFEKSRRQLVFKSASIVGRRLREDGTRDDFNKDIKPVQCLEVNDTGKSRCLTTVQKDCLVSPAKEGRYLPYEYSNGDLFRKLTPEECEKLQTVPVGYTSSVSSTQRYRQLGNGWTVDVIAHIFSSIKPN